MTHPETPPETPAASRRTAGPQTSAQWRDALRAEELPEEFDELPRRQRRRAKKKWRSARRDARTRWIKAERRRTPTGATVPIVALLVAALVIGAHYLWPDHTTTAKPKPTATGSPTAPSSPTSASSTPPPTASATPARTDPDDVARHFVTAYATRKPQQDGSHTAAVRRAAPYASAPLIANLKRHPDKDFDRLVAAQAALAQPADVTVTEPTGAQRPAPDTSIRVWRQVVATIHVTGTAPYTYTRALTVEVSRADLDQPWMVTRVLGIEE